MDKKFFIKGQVVRFGSNLLGPQGTHALGPRAWGHIQPTSSPYGNPTASLQPAPKSDQNRLKPRFVGPNQRDCWPPEKCVSLCSWPIRSAGSRFYKVFLTSCNPYCTVFFATLACSTQYLRHIYDYSIEKSCTEKKKKNIANHDEQRPSFGASHVSPRHMPRSRRPKNLTIKLRALYYPVLLYCCCCCFSH